MAILEIRTYPDPVLLEPCSPVTEFDRNLEHFVEDMFETMYKARGVGLAAPQVGVSKRIYVVNCTWEEDGADGEIALINPEIIHVEEPYRSDEGCLSFPGIYAEVERYRKVTIRYQDVKGEWHERSGEDLLARAFQHELDHLDGKVFISYLRPEQLVEIRKDIERLKRDFKKQSARPAPAVMVR